MIRTRLYKRVPTPLGMAEVTMLDTPLDPANMTRDERREFDRFAAWIDTLTSPPTEGTRMESEQPQQPTAETSTTTEVETTVETSTSPADESGADNGDTDDSGDEQGGE